MGYNGACISLETARTVLMGAQVAPSAQLNPSIVSPSIRILRQMCCDGLPVYRSGEYGRVLADATQITAETLESLYVEGADIERAIKRRGPNTLPLLRLWFALGGTGGIAAELESRL